MAREWKYTRSARGPVQANFQCPHCGLHSVHTFMGDDVVYTGSGETITSPASEGGVADRKSRTSTAKYMHWIMRCVNCQKDTYFLTKGEPNPVEHIELNPQFAGLCTVLHQYPIWNPTTHEAVPSSVAYATDEAEKCLSIDAPNACAVMTRRAIHSLCTDRGAEGSNLFAQLKDLKAKQLITPDLHEWADSLRVLGNDGAHPERPEVTIEDAEDGVKLLREIVRYVYILPHERAEKRKSK